MAKKSLQLAPPSLPPGTGESKLTTVQLHRALAATFAVVSIVTLALGVLSVFGYAFPIGIGFLLIVFSTGTSIPATVLARRHLPIFIIATCILMALSILALIVGAIMYFLTVLRYFFGGH